MLVPSESDRLLVVGEFDKAHYPSRCAIARQGPDLGIYQVLMWYDGAAHVLHVNESNELRKRAGQRAHSWPRIHRDTTRDPSAQVPQYVDRMMKLPRWAGHAEAEPLGNGLRSLVAEALRRWGKCEAGLSAGSRCDGVVPGITLPDECDPKDRCARREGREVSCRRVLQMEHPS